VRLPVTFGTRDNYSTESLVFDIAYIVLPYKAILGYPALTRFMAATHHGFNVLKIPGTNGMITVRCNEKDALCSMEHVYREAATMFPADEDLLEHSSDLMRKKQLVSQERAAAKKASLEPLLLGLSGKKFTASASPTPSEDLVDPMLDMSIGEAAVPSGGGPGLPKSALLQRRSRSKLGAAKTSSPSGQGFLQNRKARSSPSCGQTLTCSLGLRQICPAFPGR
jgi:hypothetical protein